MHTLKATFTRYVSLNIVGMIGLSCYILADTFFVAKALGAVGLAALNFSISVFCVMHGVGLMLGIGGATLFSIGSASSDEERGDVTFVHTLAAGAAVAAVCVVIGVFFTAPLGTALGADGTTLPLTQTYLKTILCFAPFFLCNDILLAFVRNDKNPRLCMIAMLVSSFANIVLDYVFMFPLSMGMFGAALATGLSPIISLCILAVHFKHKKQGFHVRRCAFRLSVTVRILSLGFSAFTGELASAISLITFNLVIGRLTGNIGVAAYGVVANIALIATAMFVGIAQGLQPLASRCRGEGDVRLTSQVLRYALVTAAVLSLALYVPVLLFSEELVAAFNGEGNARLGALAAEGLRLYFAGYLFAGVNIVAAAFLSAVGRARQSMLVASLRSCVVLVPVALAFAALFGMTGVWLSFAAAECAVFVPSVLLLRTAQKA
ncbi:MAG: MATE family efflux transporter [Clostridium sp. SCN 57-10]|nr:MAG: MATE family efflux transporter [Clostridium sp. SCN 57-10]